jgi:hypothetical protein
METVLLFSLDGFMFRTTPLLTLTLVHVHLCLLNEKKALFIYSGVL